MAGMGALSGAGVSTKARVLMSGGEGVKQWHWRQKGVVAVILGSQGDSFEC